jgi:diphthamide synthase (EF-2-diphthine--ammonia ligase)
MPGSGPKAIVTSVDPKQRGDSSLGRDFDERLLADLPVGVDPCGERGEFHTLCHACPAFLVEIRVDVGRSVHRDGCWFADLPGGR